MRLRCRRFISTTRPSMADHLPFLIEPMTLVDIDQVMEIEQVAFLAPWSARAYRYEITENDHSTMLVVRPVEAGLRACSEGLVMRLTRHLRLVRPGPVLGYAGFWMLVDEAHVCTIAVHPNWRGRGLGELLLISLLDRAIELGARVATLEVRVSNQAAQELYNKYIFEIVSRRKRYYSDNEDAYIMTTPPFDTPEFQMNLSNHRARLYARLQAARPPAGLGQNFRRKEMS